MLSSSFCHPESRLFESAPISLRNVFKTMYSVKALVVGKIQYIMLKIVKFYRFQLWQKNCGKKILQKFRMGHHHQLNKFSEDFRLRKATSQRHCRLKLKFITKWWNHYYHRGVRKVITKWYTLCFNKMVRLFYIKTYYKLAQLFQNGSILLQNGAVLL